jgi:hypothetical protein
MIHDVETIKTWFRDNDYDLSSIPDGKYTVPIRGVQYTVTILGNMIHNIVAVE